MGFVDSFYRFFEVDVGYPGRAGDNTVLARNGFMRKLETDADTYLGVGGLILGDSGASDGDRVFINPYHAPTTPEILWASLPGRLPESEKMLAIDLAITR